MADQSAARVMAAIKRQSTLGTPATLGSGAEQLRLLDSPGMKMTRGDIRSGERARHQIRNIGRLGQKTTGGEFNMELTVGGAIDMLLESICRTTASAALAPAAVANVTTTATTLVRAAGSWITEGYKVGDIITVTVDAGKSHVNVRQRVTAVTALIMTLAGTAPLVLDAVARSVTVTRLKKISTPAIPVYHLYTIEQLDEDIDESELFYDTRLTGMSFRMEPNGVVGVTARFMGLNRNLIASVAAPWFTPVTVTTGVPLVSDDAWIRYNGVDMAVVTAANIDFEIAAGQQPVIGSLTGPDVFMNDMTITGSISVVRQSLAALTAFDAATEFDLSFMFREPGADPKPTLGMFVPRVRVTDIDAPFLGGDTAKIETRAIEVGVHAGSATQDATAVVFHSSAA